MEYTIIEREGHKGSVFYSIKLGDNLYYATYEDDKIKTTNDIEFASRFLNKQFVIENVEFLKRFYNESGKRK